MIDPDKFIFLYEQQYFSTLNDNQRGGLTDLLGFINADDKVTDPRWIAYMLATTYHETDHTWLPIEEYGKGKGRPYGKPADNGQVFYGRGYVQLTWADNYKTMSTITSRDLYNHPEQAMIPAVAYKIMSYGMRNGSFTGVGLSRYFNDTKTDPINARRIINGTDQAELIAGYYDKLLAMVTA